tara:strand:- start:2329 stop:3111 length:783 start_codon:yes stop_codon:yes gene_type:complete
LRFSTSDRHRILESITDIADQAGELILEIYRTDFNVRKKLDNSPVTEADERAEAFILPALRQLLPGVPAIGEESVSQNREENIQGNTFWLVDPVDGTKEFLRRSGEFTVNIALIENKQPILGVVAAPAKKTSYRAHGKYTTERRQNNSPWKRINARKVPLAGAVIVSSRSHGNQKEIDSLLNGLKVQQQKTAGSSLKFCMVAEGEADIYPRYGPTSEWDTAAGHAILFGAGGTVNVLGGKKLLYGKKSWKNPEFIARGLT